VQWQKKLVDGFREYFREKEIRVQNRKFGIVSPNLGHISVIKSYEESDTGAFINWMIFLREIGNLQAIATTDNKNEDSLDETIWEGVNPRSKRVISGIQLWIKEYRSILQQLNLNPEERKRYVETFHPAFLPNTSVITLAIKGIESDDLSMFYDLLEQIHKPYDTNVPEELQPKGRVMTFPCSKEDQVYYFDASYHVSFTY